MKVKIVATQTANFDMFLRDTVKSCPWQGVECRDHKCDSLDLKLRTDFPRSVTILKRLLSDPWKSKTVESMENWRWWVALEEERDRTIRSRWLRGSFPAVTFTSIYGRAYSLLPHLVSSFHLKKQKKNRGIEWKQ